MIDCSSLSNRVGAIFLNRGKKTKGERLSESAQRLPVDDYHRDAWGGAGTWRISHRLLGALVLALGLVNISLGVFLAVLPLPVWIIWYIYLGFLFLLLIGMEIVALTRRGRPSKGKSTKFSGKRLPKSGVQTRISLSSNADRVVEYTIYDHRE